MWGLRRLLMKIKNPYNFAKIDEEHIDRKKDVKRFGGLSGVLTVEITFLTEAVAAGINTSEKKEFMRIGDKIGIYGSTLKGLLRATSEAISNSCISMIADKNLINRNTRIDTCVIDRNNKNAQGLCIACRIFGTTNKKISGDGDFNFAGKIKVMDAVYSGNRGNPEKRFISSTALRKPQDHHEQFYKNGNKIKGRKFYYHHQNASALHVRGEVELEVVLCGSIFTFDIIYNSLDKDEIALLLQTIELEPGLGHKLGMGKPLGLGSCVMKVVALKELDSAHRYLQPVGFPEPESVESELGERLKELKTGYKKGKALDGCPSLRSLLALPDEKDVVPIQYPTKEWFNNNKEKLPESGLLEL
jgi:CRISPR/Cas system CSM-associated protein Csm3 (group 7 of RAMP superfamily)